MLNSMIFSTYSHKWHPNSALTPNSDNPLSDMPHLMLSTQLLSSIMSISSPWTLPSGCVCFPTQPTPRVCHFSNVLSLECFASEFPPLLPSHLSVRDAPEHGLFLLWMSLHWVMLYNLRWDLKIIYISFHASWAGHVVQHTGRSLLLPLSPLFLLGERQEHIKVIHATY